jgi:hypothetical protein
VQVTNAVQVVLHTLELLLKIFDSVDSQPTRSVSVLNRRLLRLLYGNVIDVVA